MPGPKRKTTKTPTPAAKSGASAKARPRPRGAAKPSAAAPKRSANTTQIAALDTLDGNAVQSRPKTPATGAGRRRALAPGADTASRRKYVYCIIRSAEPVEFESIGIGAEPALVHTVHFKDLAAVVSDAPEGILDPTRENVLAHQRVNETVMSQWTVIPMSFGTVFKTSEDIVELLRTAYDAFSDVLEKMKDKVEFGLKVLWDRDQIIKLIESEDEDIRRLKHEISVQKGSTYFARMQYGRMIDSALQARSERFVAEISEALRAAAVASRWNKPIGDKMIMNAAFLVSRESESSFDARVKEIGTRFDNLTFKYTGPWPPYNFVNIRLKLERAQ